MPNILIICTANICRSPMAEAIFERIIHEKELPGKWNVASAGTWARDGLRASEHGQTLMKKWDMDISKHRSRVIREPLLGYADLVLTMESSHKEAIQAEFPALADRIYMLSEMTGIVRDIADPYGGAIHEYLETAREIEAYIRNGMPKILQILGTTNTGS